MRSCRRCGAALDEGDEPVACPQCGIGDPASGVAPAGPQAYAASATTPAAGPSPAVKVLLAVGMAFVGLGFAWMFFARMEPPEEAAPSRRPGRAAAAGASDAAAGARGPQGAPLETYLDALCFADANGDDVPDPVLWLDGETRGRVVAVDGRTGRGLWSSQGFAKPDALACGGAGTVLAGGEEDESLHALDARTGKERWASKLAAVPDEVVVGDGCVTVLMKDGAATGLTIEGGEPADCPSAPRPAAYTGAFWERKKNPQLVQLDDIQVTVTAQTPGPPTLTAEGRRGGASLWKVELPARAPVSGGRPDVFLVASGGAAVALGVDAGGGAEPRLIALEAASGAFRYQKPAGYLGGRVATMKASGPYVYTISGAGLRAVDPATGEVVWRATAPAKSL
jgi:outer membrane protein assembly factor BamB